MRKSILSILTALCMTNVFAGNTDVKPICFDIGDTYVRVTKLANTNIRFEECVYGYEETTCKTLGNKDSYTVTELSNRKVIEALEALGVIVGETAFLAVAGAWSYLVLKLGGGSFFALATGIGGPAIGLAVPALVKGLNPVIQSKQVFLLRSNIINDKDVRVNDIEKYVQKLDQILSKID